MIKLFDILWFNNHMKAWTRIWYPKSISISVKIQLIHIALGWTMFLDLVLGLTQVLEVL